MSYAYSYLFPKWGWIYFSTFHLRHCSDKYYMILWIREGLQSVALAFTGTTGLPQWYDLAMGRVGVAVSSFLRVKDTLIPNTHDVLEF